MKTKQVAARVAKKQSYAEMSRQFEVRVRPAAQAVAAIRKARRVSVEEAVSQLVTDLGLYCNDQEIDFWDAATDGVEGWRRYMSPETAPQASIIISDPKFQEKFVHEARLDIGLRPVFISYGAEDEELASQLTGYWGDGADDTFMHGRGKFDDYVARKAIDDTMSQSKLCLVLASPESREDEPTLAHVLKSAVQKGVPVQIVSRSSWEDWARALKSMGVARNDAELSKCNIQVAMFRSGSLDQLVAWIKMTSGSRFATR